MYPCGRGHFGVHLHAYNAGGGVIEITADAGQSVDNIYYRREDYITWCRDLHSTLADCLGAFTAESRREWQLAGAPDRRLTFQEQFRREISAESDAAQRKAEHWEAIEATLRDIASVPDERAQCRAFRDAAFRPDGTPATLSSYAPENDNSCAWAVFRQRFHKTDATLQRSYGLARAWATAPR
jgi:hypothetical protein